MEEERLRELAWVQEVLAEHYARRLEIHPNRDIFPADWFFHGDSVKLKPEAYLLVSEIAKMQKQRVPWSRIVVAAYNTAPSESKYSEFLTKNRAKSIARQFITSGVEPRRVMTRALTLDAPVLVDPDDHPFRYKQAIEIIAIDK
jgi:outer membrane protein OmpA-like peptidoglycan-associated protein